MATYAFTDTHGYYNVVEQILNFAKPDDKIYFLGDACDRGPDGIKSIQALLDDKRVEYLLGNHEGLLLNFAAQYSTYSIIDPNEWFENGGRPTMEAYLNLKEQEQEELVSQLYNLKVRTFYTRPDGSKVFLSHAGATPYNAEQVGLNDYLEEYLFTWGREHINIPWAKNKYKNMYIVHGHTPAQLIQTTDEIVKEGGMARYARGHKICIDLGTPSTGVVSLLNLDTLKIEKIFKVDNF